MHQPRGICNASVEHTAALRKCLRENPGPEPAKVPLPCDTPALSGTFPRNGDPIVIRKMYTLETIAAKESSPPRRIASRKNAPHRQRMHSHQNPVGFKTGFPS